LQIASLMAVDTVQAAVTRYGSAGHGAEVKVTARRPRNLHLSLKKKERARDQVLRVSLVFLVGAKQK